MGSLYGMPGNGRNSREDVDLLSYSRMDQRGKMLLAGFEPRSWRETLGPGESKNRTDSGVRKADSKCVSRGAEDATRGWEMLAVPRAEWRGRGWREMGTELGASSSRGGRGGRRELFALDFVPVFLLQRPRKAQQGVN